MQEEVAYPEFEPWATRWGGKEPFSWSHAMINQWELDCILPPPLVSWFYRGLYGVHLFIYQVGQFDEWDSARVHWEVVMARVGFGPPLYQYGSSGNLDRLLFGLEIWTWPLQKKYRLNFQVWFGSGCLVCVLSGWIGYRLMNQVWAGNVNLKVLKGHPDSFRRLDPRIKGSDWHLINGFAWSPLNSIWLVAPVSCTRPRSNLQLWI